MHKHHNSARLLAITALALGAIGLAGCGDSGGAAKSSLPEKQIEITGNDQMKFDTTIIEAKPGQKVVLTFKNVGTMPKESMGHNWVLLAKNTDPAKFIEAGFVHASNDYIDPAMQSKALAKTKTLGPGETETITFTAPSIAGPYDYVCTFPGHFAAGMKGQLIVQ